MSYYSSKKSPDEILQRLKTHVAARTGRPHGVRDPDWAARGMSEPRVMPAAAAADRHAGMFSRHFRDDRLFEEYALC